MSSTSWPSSLEQPGGVLERGGHLRVQLHAGHRRLQEPADPQPPGAPVGAAEERLPRRRGGAQYGSPATGPAIASSIAAASRTVRASGPLVPRPVTSQPSGALLTRPRVGLMPNSPLMPAGMRIEPPPSLPCANGSRPGRHRDRRAAAGAAGQQGGVPGAAGRPGEVVVGVAGEAELGGVRLAEADRAGGGQRGDHGVVDRRARSRRCTGEPNVVRTPAVLLRSLIAVGTPSSGGSSPPARSRSSAAAAAARARSAVTVMKAPRPASSASMRARECSTSSVGLTSLARTAAACSSAVRSCSASRTGDGRQCAMGADQAWTCRGARRPRRRRPAGRVPCPLHRRDDGCSISTATRWAGCRSRRPPPWRGWSSRSGARGLVGSWASLDRAGHPDRRRAGRRRAGRAAGRGAGRRLDVGEPLQAAGRRRRRAARAATCWSARADDFPTDRYIVAGVAAARGMTVREVAARHRRGPRPGDARRGAGRAGRRRRPLAGRLPLRRAGRHRRRSPGGSTTPARWCCGTSRTRPARCPSS